MTSELTTIDYAAVSAADNRPWPWPRWSLLPLLCVSAAATLSLPPQLTQLRELLAAGRWFEAWRTESMIATYAGGLVLSIVMLVATVLVSPTRRPRIARANLVLLGIALCASHLQAAQAISQIVDVHLALEPAALINLPALWLEVSLGLLLVFAGISDARGVRVWVGLLIAIAGLLALLPWQTGRVAVFGLDPENSYRRMLLRLLVNEGPSRGSVIDLLDHTWLRAMPFTGPFWLLAGCATIARTFVWRTLLLIACVAIAFAPAVDLYLVGDVAVRVLITAVIHRTPQGLFFAGVFFELLRLPLLAVMFAWIGGRIALRPRFTETAGASR